jgi:NADPH-dependent 7-cyano-7-deazaguanine reductase QueF
MIKTLPNSERHFEVHTLAIPPCCPVSKNPRKGMVRIMYRPRGQVLEIASLMAYIHSFRGGLYNSAGELEVRDMEGMINRIAYDCSVALRVPVRVYAHLDVLPRQQMDIRARAYPHDNE